MDLAQKTCTPCRGGVAPLTFAEADRYLAAIPGWTLEENATKIKRSFRFSDFGSALAFVDRIGALAEAEGHHPDLSFGWGYCVVVFQTHKIKGLHENDFVMAAKVSALAPAR
jgi:4a-hydroxytetrahydrobiopterin dehydratase